MQSSRDDVQLLVPNVERDSPFALNWFERPEGHATLLSMGNAENEIEPSTLEGEKATLREFLDLEKDNKQITRMIIVDSRTIGAVWIELFENHGVKPPSVHIMIGDPDYRGKGIGRAVMKSAINYVRDILQYEIIYTRYLANNLPIAKLNGSLGFEKDGEPYEDENRLTWQAVKMTLKSP